MCRQQNVVIAPLVISTYIRVYILRNRPFSFIFSAANSAQRNKRLTSGGKGLWDQHTKHQHNKWNQNQKPKTFRLKFDATTSQRPVLTCSKSHIHNICDCEEPFAHPIIPIRPNIYEWMLCDAHHLCSQKSSNIR